jgi:hypothetical protein
MRTDKPRARIIHLMCMVSIFAVALAVLPIPFAVALTAIESLLMILYLAGYLRLIELIVAMAVLFILFMPNSR